MDVLRPPVIRIGNRCYRKNPVLSKDVNTAEEDVTDFIVEDSSWNDEVCDARTVIEETESGFKTSLPVPSGYFKYIIGKKGETRRRLETETRTQIRIPKQGQEGNIVIVGHDRKGVMSAKTRIDVLVDSARQRQPFTHFLSIPVNTDLLKHNFEEFKSDVLRDCDGDRGIDGTIFQNANKLHLTIGLLVLMDDAEVQRAIDVLGECKTDLVEPILRDDPLHVRFQGLEYMNDDPAEVDVLYAKVQPGEEAEILQILADRLVDKFTSTGLMQREYDHVKLHATIMNTIFRKDPLGASEIRKPDKRTIKERESFDATNLLKKFKEYDFGPHHINTVHISQRYSAGSDSYYTCAGSIGLP